MDAIPHIDPRVRYVGTSILRTLKTRSLRELRDTVYVIQRDDKPLAVLMSYEAYLKMQAAWRL